MNSMLQIKCAKFLVKQEHKIRGLSRSSVALLERNRVALLQRFLSRSWEKPVALSRRCRAYFYSAPALQPMKIFDVFFLRYFFFHEIDSHFDF